MQKVDVYGDVPLARFGHTMTLVNKSKAVLFGGATGDTGKYIITGDAYSLDLLSNTWTKLEGQGIAPTPRAAHAACAVDALQLVVYGGATGGGSLASDDLYLLDLRSGENSAQWMIVPVVGLTPGRRYGHSLIFNKPHLLVCCGNTGQEPVNDIWCLNVERSPFQWVKIDTASENPAARVYHSAALCSSGSATGMMVIFGGRKGDGTALNDTWGLRRHRDGRWDWVQAPYKQAVEAPLQRYQHSSIFMGTMMIVVGGRTNSVNQQVALQLYDTETSEWYKFPSIQRFRHACWAIDSNLFIHGGFEHDSPNVPKQYITRLDTFQVFKHAPNIVAKLDNLFHKPAGASLGSSAGSKPSSHSPSSAISTSPSSYTGAAAGRASPGGPVRNTTPPITQVARDKLGRGYGGDKGGVTLVDHAIVMDSSGMRQVVPVMNLNSDASKIADISVNAGAPPGRKNVQNLYTLFLNHLLRPSEWAKNQVEYSDNFPFRREHILALTDQCQSVIEKQPMVLNVKVPIKVFGDIHGQYQDLMRFFDLWGMPAEDEGDIESYDYLFLGDYVDRGSHSLETICLLMALKVRHPESIHLLRGNHEDKWINNAFGFADECAARLGEDPSEPNSVFNRVNELFDYLPLAAIVENKIICLHGGIGSTVSDIAQIRAIPRPLEVIHEVSTQEQQLVVDILWSDPTDNDHEIGIQPNFIRDPNGTGNIVKFGPDRVRGFLENNNLTMILRAHECVMDGFERFAGGSLITVFSATDYCARHKNAGAVLFITRTLEINPKLIYPLNNPEQNWITDEEPLKKRPPTPPRWTNQNPRRSFD